MSLVFGLCSCGLVVKQEASQLPQSQGSGGAASPRPPPGRGIWTRRPGVSGTICFLLRHTASQVRSIKCKGWFSQCLRPGWKSSRPLSIVTGIPPGHPVLPLWSCWEVTEDSSLRTPPPSHWTDPWTIGFVTNPWVWQFTCVGNLTDNC